MLAGCIQNTLTGNMDSCSNDACICKEGFAPPDCCNCDLTGVSGRPHYLDPVTNKCTRESICMHGMIGPIINPTKLLMKGLHARTSFLNRIVVHVVCAYISCMHLLTCMCTCTCNHAAYCRENCPQPDLDGCDQCTVGYKPRDCCQCEDGYFDKQGICSSECYNYLTKRINHRSSIC